MIELVFAVFLILMLAVALHVFRTPSRNDYSAPKTVSGFQVVETLRRAAKK